MSLRESDVASLPLFVLADSALECLQVSPIVAMMARARGGQCSAEGIFSTLMIVELDEHASLSLIVDGQCRDVASRRRIPSH